MTHTLEVQLLGGFLVKLNGQPIHSFRTVKTRALLAYLAIEANREHSRATLATLFWGELPERAAKTNLRIELSNLKGLLYGHPALELSRTVVSFRRELATTDAHAFQQAVSTFLALPTAERSAQLDKLAAAVALYQGEFLAGFHLSDVADFEDWQLLARERLHEQLMAALKTLQAAYGEQGRWGELADACRRQLAIVPWIEAAHRGLMQALAAQGQLQPALAQFEKCRTILQKELGVEPSLPTVELAARLRAGGDTTPALLKHNLPPQLKAFVGRKEEMGRLQALLKSQMLVTILGIGGVGKSHLAQAVAQSLLHDFSDGVWFVSLANIEAGNSATERIALAIAAAVGFHVTNMQAPLSELMGYLTAKRMLLVLDNWDHLIGSAATVLHTLFTTVTIHILATSRVPLLVEGETIFHLEGLPTEEAYTLFLDRARHVVTGFAPEESARDRANDIASDILRICEQVAGLPLEIEVAASWVKLYSVSEIGQSIAKLAIAPQPSKGLVARDHHATRVLEYSWRRLSPHQQQILSKLSVFRGGFDRAAAGVVAESKFSDLSALISHSLVQNVAAGRYDLHPLIQEFAADKLAAGAATTLYTSYSRHYLQMLINSEQGEWAARLRLDFENIRSAWQRATEARDALMIEQAVTPFGDYIAQFGLIPDGERLFQEAALRFDGAVAHRELVARLLGQQSIFSHALYGLKAASLLQQRLLTLTSNRELQIKTHSSLAIYYAEIGAWSQADAHFDSIQALVEESADLGLYIRAVENRTRVNVLHFRGDFAQEIARLHEMITLLEAAPVPLADANEIHRMLLRTLNSVATRYGDYAAAIRYCHQWMAKVVSQRQRQQVVGGLALSEEYAGIFEQALTHHQEALAMAMDIGDTDSVSVVKVNLAMTLRQLGQLEEALIYGVESVEIFSRLGHKRIEGQGRNRVGHILLAFERWAEAYEAYSEALGVWDPLQHPNRFEAVAGRAVAALRLGKQAEALAAVEEVLAFVTAKGVVGIVEPVRLFLNCEMVLNAVGEDERACDLLLQANKWVQTIAGRISDDHVRATFLNNRPDNQLLKARIMALG